MNKQEFESRTGFVMPDDRYAEVEQMYYAAGESIDKDTFCKDFKKHADSALLNAFYQKCHKLSVELKKQRAELKNTARMLIVEANEYNNETLRNHAIQILGGYSEYLREKINLEIPFDSTDYEYLKENL